MASPVSITASYAFFPILEEELPAVREELIAFGNQWNMKGLVLLATEGINATVCGSKDAIAAWKDRLKKMEPTIVFKDSTAEAPVFKRWSVKIKPEIVALKQPLVRPQGSHKHLSPRQWQEVIEREDVIVLDARNDYEVALGTFRNAINFDIRKFHEFPAKVALSGLPKDKKVLMYCTGGIRCEKALLELEGQGYKDVYQLEGGILAYLEQFPEKDFQGECFVFDKRTAVDQYLQPSKKYDICPHCGLPGDERIHCGACKNVQLICSNCAKRDERRTCSKRCAHEKMKLLIK